MCVYACVWSWLGFELWKRTRVKSPLEVWMICNTTRGKKTGRVCVLGVWFCFQSERTSACPSSRSSADVLIDSSCITAHFSQFTAQKGRSLWGIYSEMAVLTSGVTYTMFSLYSKMFIGGLSWQTSPGKANLFLFVFYFFALYLSIACFESCGVCMCHCAQGYCDFHSPDSKSERRDKTWTLSL